MKKNIYISPSILSADFANLGDAVKKADMAGADYIHLDVMDGNFVPNISFGPAVIKALRKYTNKVFDVHLMIEEPIRYIEDFALAGSDIICVHAESCKHLHRTIMKIKEMNIKAAVAINPATPVDVLEHVIDQLDMVLIMSVNPGFGGQSFINESLNKISEVKKMAERKNLDINIEVDGGITANNLEQVVNVGANVIVAGSAIFNGDIENNIEGFKKIIENVE